MARGEAACSEDAHQGQGEPQRGEAARSWDRRLGGGGARICCAMILTVCCVQLGGATGDVTGAKQRLGVPLPQTTG